MFVSANLSYVKLLPLCLLPFAQAASENPTTVRVHGHQYTVNQVITRNVSIIGGGSSGTYSAIRLRDSGKSVVVVEATDHLGGHTQTYIDPVTGIPIDYGVEIFHPFDIVYNYFARLNVTPVITQESGIPGVVTEYADFLTGKPDLSLIYPGNISAALKAYAAQVFQYPYLDYGFDLPNPIPPDLLLPFGDFVKKYSLDALVPFAWNFAEGVGDILTIPTLYVMKAFGPNDILDLQTGFLTTALHDNSLLYSSAQAILGDDVLYSSTVLAVERNTQNGVKMVVKTPTLGLILIESKTLIIAIQPTPDNLSPIDLDDHEQHLFTEFTWTEYFTGILKNTGIPSNTSLVNTSPSLPYTIPAPPSIYTVEQTGDPGLLLVTYLTTDITTSDNEIEDSIISQVKKVDVAGKTASNPEFVVSSNHKPFTLSVSAEEIEEGFYGELLELQGEKGTWYVSASFHTHDSSLIWRYFEGLLPNITAAS